MSSNKNPFLDDLFPDPMRARKARIFKGYEKVSNTAAFRFSALSSKVKAEGVADKRAEVMFRFGQANIKSYLHTIKATDYIARNGDIELIDQSGNSLQGKAEYRKVLYEWKLLSEMGDGTSKRGHARRVILSMPAGTDEEKFKTACGQWAKDMLDGYDYLLAFHLPGNDTKTTQPHCHVLLRTKNREGKRIHLANDELAAMREHFAACLLKCGIEANATRRWSRGKTQQGISQAEHHVLNNRRMSEQDRARVYAIAKKRELLKRQQAQVEKVHSAFRDGKVIPDSPSIQKTKKTRKTVVYLAEQASRKLIDSPYAEEQQLGRKMQNYYSKLEPVESAEQKTLRQLNEAKQQQIKRMQAMRKRLKKGSQKPER